MSLVRRLGSAMRHAVTGLTHAGRSRRNPPPPGTTPSTTQNPAATTAARRPRRPRGSPAPAAAPARPGWFARCWSGLQRRRTALSRRASLPQPEDEAFTPENHPGYSPEVCELLNTPVGECDPVLLCGVFRVFAACIADKLPPELGLNDPDALFSTIWGEVSHALDQPDPDAPAAEQMDAAPAEHPDAAPASPPIAAQDAPPPDTRSRAQAGRVPRRPATAGSAAPEAPPDNMALPLPLPRRRRRASSQTRCTRSKRYDGALLRPGWRTPRQYLPSRRRAYYACAGPR